MGKRTWYLYKTKDLILKGELNKLLVRKCFSYLYFGITRHSSVSEYFFLVYWRISVRDVGDTSTSFPRDVSMNWNCYCMSKKLARGNPLIPVLYLLDPKRTVFHTNMVRTSMLGKLRMHKQNIKTIVPLDVVPERRTKRFPPSSRPGDRFVRQGSDTCPLAPGERNISSQTMYDRSLSSTRPVDQVEQFLFKINSVPAISSVWYVEVCQRMCSYNWTRLKGHIYASLVLCPYGIFWRILAQNRRHLRMRI